jgi:hypothetical protein
MKLLWSVSPFQNLNHWPPHHIFQFAIINNTNMMDTQTYDMGVTVAPPLLVSLNDTW